ncbi:jg6787 [Pararge aegeria aegeria]|uniref:Jg6787 protein n=2 Tax=Pararge aegeria TaxID=116150 RepID=A0A8S4RQ56_9NEOP|nr:jg6787 [Pararge aegeria aegeria]
MNRVWSNKKIIKFINEVHVRPELWNVSVAAYRDRKAKFNAWSAVAAQFNITPDVAYKKFRNLRTYAKTEHKKKGGKPISWFAYDAISFILSGDGSDRGIDSEANPKTITDRPERDDGDSIVSEESSDTSVEPEPKVPLKKPIRSQIPEPIERVHINDSVGRNPYSSFGEYVANKLSTYDSYTRAQTEFKISKILFDADMGMFRQTERQFPAQFPSIYPNYSEQQEMTGGSDLKSQCTFLQPQDSLQGPSNNRP